MSQHYNAFISYKHGPLDNKVAAEVQTQLERFRIPKAIRKKTGIQKIDRIFRDKEELNITSDLNETIENALQNSDYLIVICSPKTKESIWVQREIEFFLKTHPMGNVMTVVAEGEPIDAVPEILFYKETEITTEAGTVETVKVPMEPLSCDYRMDFRKARKEELPRLAAAILGCGYDDLRQRQRKYRQRRNVILASAAGVALASLAGYYAYTAAQIQANYEQSLINQSEYLAAESQKMMEQGDRVTAMLLAIEALPHEGNERPITASAQLALSDALYAYMPKGGNMRGASLGIKKSFDHSGDIEEYLITNDRAYLAVAHSGNRLSMWDFEGCELLFEKQFAAPYQTMAFTKEQTLVFAIDEELFCIDPASGETLWSRPASDFSQEESLSKRNFTNLCLAVSPTDHILALEYENCLNFVDTRSGEILSTHSENPANYSEDLSCWDLSFGELIFSSDGTRLAGYFSSEYGAYNDKQAFLYDILEEKMYIVSDLLPRFEAILFTPEGNLIVAGSRRADEFTYTNDNYDYYYINQMEINCYDPIKDKLLWNTDFTFSDYYQGTHILLGEFPMEDETFVPALICGASNTVAAVDLSSGELLGTLSFEDTILYMECSNDSIHCLMENGRIGLGFWNEFNASTEFTIPDLASVTLDPALLAVKKGSSSLLWYSSEVFDEDWAAFQGENQVGFSSFYLESNGCGILEGYDKMYHHIDPRKQTLTWSVSMDTGDGYYHLKYVGYDTVADEYLFFRDNDDTILRYSSNGTLAATTPLAINIIVDPELESALYSGENAEELQSGYYALETPGIVNDMLYYPAQHVYTEEYGLIIEQNGSARVIPFPMEASYIRDCIASPDGSKVLMKDGDNKYIVVDLTSETAAYTSWTLELADTRIAWNQDGSLLAAADTNCVRIFHEDHEVTIDTHGVMVIDLEFLKDMLLVIYADGNLIRYKAEDGTYIGQTDISAAQGFSALSSVHWNFSFEDKYAVIMDDTFNLIDPETWNLYTTIGCVVSYDLENEIIIVPRTLESSEITEENKPYELGYFHLYTPEELVDKATSALNGTTLTEEQKSQYGLG